MDDQLQRQSQRRRVDVEHIKQVLETGEYDRDRLYPALEEFGRMLFDSGQQHSAALESKAVSTTLSG